MTEGRRAQDRILLRVQRVRHLARLQNRRDHRRRVPLISHYVVSDAAQPRAEKFALRSLAAAIGTFERNQKTARLLLLAQHFPQPPLLGLLDSRHKSVIEEYTLHRLESHGFPRQIGLS